MATTKNRDSRLENLQTSKRKEIDFCRKCGKSFKTSDLLVRRSIYYCKNCVTSTEKLSLRSRICDIAEVAFKKFKQLGVDDLTITRPEGEPYKEEIPPFAVVVLDLQSRTVQSVDVFYGSNHVSYKVKE